MNLFKSFTVAAIICTTTASFAQSGTTNVSTTAAAHEDGVAMLTRELKLDAKQQKAVADVFASCEKDCAAMASTGKGDATGGKQARMNKMLSDVNSTLTADQQKQFDKLKADGKLAGLCDSKGCCSGKAKGACCAGHSGAGAAAPAK